MSLEEHNKVFCPWASVPNSTASTPSNGISTKGDLKVKLAQLESSIDGLPTDNKGKSLNMFDYSLHNLQEFGAHVLVKNVNHFGGIVDVYTFCQWMKADKKPAPCPSLWLRWPGR
jgi:hypothetical protein